MLAADVSQSTTDQPSLPDFDALWDYNKPAQTEARFRELLPVAEKSGNASYLAQLLTQLARAQGLQRNFADAHQTLNRVEPMLTDDLPVARIRYLLERGRVFNSSCKPAEAKPFFVEAWDRAQVAGEDSLAIDAVHMLAIVATPDEALEWNKKAIALAANSASEKARGWLGSLYNNLGWAYHGKGEFAKALEVFEKDAAWFEARQKKEEWMIARWSAARTLRSLGRLDEALQRQRALLRERQEQQLTPDGYVFEEIAECLQALGRTGEARPFFSQAHGLLRADAFLVETERQRIERLRELGGVKEENT